MLRRPPRSTRTDTHVPDTTPFRSRRPQGERVMPDDLDPREGSGALRWSIVAAVLAVFLGMVLAGCAPSYKPLPETVGRFEIIPMAEIKARKIGRAHV